MIAAMKLYGFLSQFWLEEAVKIITFRHKTIAKYLLSALTDVVKIITFRHKTIAKYLLFSCPCSSSSSIGNALIILLQGIGKLLLL